ncbi:hypothetical protein [Marivita geojedonensis]|uniref:ATP-grasp domain-containing protein n=1 Tax=Marivita geojedonensis TaxID=1123756 RepID=A0A1X4NQ17_9RHOB|nr:hypothetical protein [Marivita geojedonensis]OSQ53049.1 hypothetical protein MGEO_00265 [Marivita geojedonensis]PRY82038.1 D-alanine-D-alanine ligase-like ATP-grasp enzyme [Marivita geojedonensis]
MKDFLSQSGADTGTVEDTLATYHRMFRPYFEEYAGLETNTYDVSSSTDVKEMVRAARAHGLDVHAFPSLPARHLVLSDGTREIGFAAAQPSCMKPVLTNFCDDKLLQKTFYKENGIPHAEGHEVRSLEHALESRRSLAESVVLKPSRGRQGLGVTVGIRDDETLIRAWNFAREERSQSPIMMEETFVGCDLRAFILNKEVICAYLKIPPNILGDGRSTIAELVDAKNARRRQSPALRVALIKTDAKSEQLLEFQGFDMGSIPANGEPVLLGLTQSVSSGGDLLPINGRLSKPVNTVACSVAKALGYTGPPGMDVLCRDFEKDTGSAIICETNPQPAMFGALYPPVGKSVDCPEQIMRHYFGARRKTVKPKDIRIRCEGAEEIELEAFCDSYAESGANGKLLRKTGPQELTIEGTGSDVSMLLSTLLDSKKKPKFIDAAYVLKPLKKKKAAKSAIPLERPGDTACPASEFAKIACMSSLSKQADILDGNLICLTKTRKRKFVSAQLNGWFAEAHSSLLGRSRLRHRFALHGLPLKRELILEPKDVRGLRRAVARFKKDCTVTLIARSNIQSKTIVSNADEASDLLSREVNNRTKLVCVSPNEDTTQMSLLVFDGSLVAATQDSGTECDTLHAEWAQVASACLDALPSARLMSVKVHMENPQDAPDNQTWAIDSIDTNPDIAHFGTRVANPKGAFAKKLVAALLDSTI